MKTIKNRNNNGRPKKPTIEVKDYIVRVRLDMMEYFTLTEKAREAGMSLSHYIRIAINGSVVKQRLSKENNRIILQLTAGLNNLNQLTKKAHQVGYLAVEQELKPVVTGLENTIKQIEYDG